MTVVIAATVTVAVTPIKVAVAVAVAVAKTVRATETLRTPTETVAVAVAEIIRRRDVDACIAGRRGLYGKRREGGGEREKRVCVSVLSVSAKRCHITV